MDVQFANCLSQTCLLTKMQEDLDLKIFNQCHSAVEF